tara:strand:- start:4864 stop:5472 length:609 start_codon:yes stop_codon:yes gene_type:complete
MTQAINLANFSNSLDSSGQVPPTSLNAAVPFSKGGTGATTQAAAAAAFGTLLYPVGSIYINATNATNPATLFGFGTWTAFGAGRVPVGFNSANVLFDTAEETGGSADAIIPFHTHTFTGTALPTHTHNINSSFTNLSSIGSGTTTPIGGVQTTTTQPASAGTPAGTNSNATSANWQGDATVTNINNANYQPYITVYMWKRTA